MPYVSCVFGVCTKCTTIPFSCHRAASAGGTHNEATGPETAAVGDSTSVAVGNDVDQSLQVMENHNKAACMSCVHHDLQPRSYRYLYCRWAFHTCHSCMHRSATFLGMQPTSPHRSVGAVTFFLCCFLPPIRRALTYIIYILRMLLAFMQLTRCMWGHSRPRLQSVRAITCKK